ncbi:MAG: histidine kinase [Thermodesulfobacteriota bacterium]
MPSLRDQPASRLRSQAKLIFGGSLATGLQVGLVQCIMVQRWSPLPSALFGAMVYGFAALLLWQWVFPRVTTQHRSTTLLLQVLITFGVITVTSFLLVNGMLLFQRGGWMFSPYTGGDLTVIVPASWLQKLPLLYFAVPIVPVVLITVIGFNQSWWQIFLLEKRESQARELASLAQLEALRARINPHFLFNSLNSIAQLISTDPDRAEACVERLAEIFRYLLQSDNRSFVTLEDELEIADAYLDIERARFGDRLAVDFVVSDGARHGVVPTLILQPLIENAVRHGVSQKVGGGTVSIEASLDGPDLRVVIRDTGVGMRDGVQAALSAGVGLRNVHDRLVHLYGEQYAPRIDSRPGEGTVITVRVPQASSPPGELDTVH